MKIALYFDCQNVSHTFFSDVVRYCQNERYEIVIKKAYKDFTKRCGWDEILQASDIEAIQIFNHKPNSSDVSLCLDVLEDTMRFNQIDIVGIISSDCDFASLIIKLKKMNKVVLGFGEQKTKQSIKDAYSNFILLSRQDSQISDFSDIIQAVKENMGSDGYACNAKIIKSLKSKGGKISPIEYGYSSWRNLYQSNTEIFKLNPLIKSDIAVALA
ncbi:NYN domain-containing protein [Campylobacter gastrosuis]|uniref:NYN domain-containing protein n=1 Tax=Campylobacter gastrosuis TaxID=2974576 RepID=A0ABT7HPR1_9BACT|nr:NYN domain-containing protein [Campylobacter gastrosuis]MDL0088917.1 NYN domain-containing protein [Campylobacter gastrosuis]